MSLLSENYHPRDNFMLKTSVGLFIQAVYYKFTISRNRSTYYMFVKLIAVFCQTLHKPMKVYKPFPPIDVIQNSANVGFPPTNPAVQTNFYRYSFTVHYHS